MSIAAVIPIRYIFEEVHLSCGVAHGEATAFESEVGGFEKDRFALQLDETSVGK